MSEKPILIPRDDGKWELAEEWNGIPAGFVTDGASLPRFFWRLLGAPVEAKTIGAFIEHDWDYQTGRISRKAADDKLYYNLRNCGVNVVASYVYWLGVRGFGWMFYVEQKSVVSR